MRGLPALAFSLLLIPGPSQDWDETAHYLRAVAEYRAGSVSTPVNVVAQGSPDALLAGRVIARTSRWKTADLGAAAMLHTDVLLRQVKAGRMDDAAAHLETATALLHAVVQREPSRLAYARRWRTTVAALLYSSGPPLTSRLDDGALPWLAMSAEQKTAAELFDWGLAAEIRAAVAGPLSGPVPKKAPAFPAEAMVELRTAARNFESAVVSDPGRLDAALHLGRIRLIEGRDADANVALRQAAAVSASVPVRYLAMSFLGALAERDSRPADAEAHYREAMDLFPWGQSAPLALSQLLMRAGREADARGVLATHFEGTRGRVAEPLRTYLSDPQTDLGLALDLLRAETWTR